MRTFWFCMMVLVTRKHILCPMVSPQSQQIEFHLIVTNRLFHMWLLLNRARFSVITCLNALLTHHIEIIIIFGHLDLCLNTHAGFNEIVALNSTSQFIKDDILYMPSSYSPLCCRPDLVKESINSFIRSTVTT